MPPLFVGRATALVLSTLVAFACLSRSEGTRVSAQTVPGTNGQPGLGTNGQPAPVTPGPSFATPQPFGTPEATSSTPIPTGSPSPPAGRRLDTFFLAAKQIAFYSSRYIIGADHDIAVTLGDGTIVTGNTFAMDLRLNRFVVAGNVTVSMPSGTTQHGAAFADYLDFDRAYFIPITSKPDRWTFVAGDYAHPLLGRQMPGDTFFLPDLSGDRVFLFAHHATIDPKQSVRFTPASLNFGVGAFVEFPSYFLNFSPNPNFAQNSLAGAYVDGPLDLFGGEHGLLTANIRYDASNGLYPAIEAHQVSERHYVVGSISPLTRPFKLYNLLAFDRLSPGLQIQTSFQESAYQHAFNQPLAASAYAALQVTGSLRQSYLQLATQNYYSSVLAMPAPFYVNGDKTTPPVYFYGDPTHNFVPDHPINAQLNLIGFRQRLGKYLHTQVRSGMFYAHNATPQAPLTTLSGRSYPSIYGGQLGFDLTSEPITLLKDEVGRPKVYLTGVFDKQRQFFNTPHFIDTQQEVFALSDIVVPRKLSALASYSIVNTGDFYGRLQSLVYSGDFRGFGTSHTLAEQIVYTPSTDFTLNLALRENRDYPVPAAGLPTVVGGTTSFLNSGNPPYQADLDVRFRVAPTLVLDVSRSYYFGFGGYERFSPQFYVQILR